MFFLFVPVPQAHVEFINAIPLYVSSNQSLIEVNSKMTTEYGHFPSDWAKVSEKPQEYRKKAGVFEIIATENEGVCEKCEKMHLGFLFKTIDHSGNDIENSKVYWCPECGGMTPEAYESFVRTELLYGRD